MKTFLYFLLLLVGVFTSDAKNIEKSPLSGPRIVGGTDAEDGFAPYQVSIQSETEGHLCGGAIISERYILTAAHCVEDKHPEDIYIVTGTNKWKVPGAKYNIENWIIHSEYDEKEYHDDIAVLRLTKSIVWNKKTKPVDLPSKQNLKPSETLIATGWGWTNYETEKTPEKLQKLLQKYVSYEECYDNLKEKQHNLSAGHICAFEEDGKGLCGGDSGGPLVTENKELVGIVNWGIACAVGYPDVYASTFYYKDWIKDSMKKLEKKSTN